MRHNLRHQLIIQIGLGSLAGLLIISFQNCTKRGVQTINSPQSNVDSASINKACGADPGHVMIQRLSNAEYVNTMKDLLYTKSDFTAPFPAETLGASGFSNDAINNEITDQLIYN